MFRMIRSATVGIKLFNVILLIALLLFMFGTMVSIYINCNIISLIGAEELSREKLTVTISDKDIEKVNSSELRYSIKFRWENDTRANYGKTVSKKEFNDLQVMDKMPAEKIIYKLKNGSIKENILVDTFEYGNLERLSNFLFELLVN